MCTTNIFTYVHPDGRKEQAYQPDLCSASRHGLPCANEMVFQHPEQYVGYSAPLSYGAQLPPSPAYTPRSTTPNYRSGDESDRSFHSSSSSKKRLSGLYINGQKVLDIERHRRPSSRHERIVLVDSPPTPRTPPQTWAAPHTAPSSPNAYVVDASPRDSSSRRRAVIVDERSRNDRPHVKIEVVEEGPKRSKHSRHTSTSSRDSRTSNEEEKRQRRKRHEERKREEKEIREQKLRARIAEANAEIAGRPAVPVAPAPRRASTYKRGAVEVRDQEAELVEAVSRLNFEEARREEKARRLAEKEAAKEEEAQRQRLMERMMPKRRATVGPGSRRHRVLYDDGLYRWE